MTTIEELLESRNSDMGGAPLWDSTEPGLAETPLATLFRAMTVPVVNLDLDNVGLGS